MLRGENLLIFKLVKNYLIKYMCLKKHIFYLNKIHINFKFRSVKYLSILVNFYINYRIL